MNMTCAMPTKEFAVTAPEAQAACELILTSDKFINAPRMSRLLQFLVRQVVSGNSRDTSEYVIGIKVFDQNPATYNPAENPIVRVQVGRLRKKIQAYYAVATSEIAISIPLGTYMPIIQRLKTEAVKTEPDSVLALHQIKCITKYGYGEEFAQGLQEELTHQLFNVFGRIFVPHQPDLPNNKKLSSEVSREVFETGSKHSLEASIRMDTKCIRTSVRLIDASQGHVTWSAQFDSDNFYAISLQEELASSICGALMRFYNPEELQKNLSASN